MDDNDLEDPRYARFAWARYRSLMVWMTAAAAVTTAVSLWVLEAYWGEMPLLAAIFSGGGIFLTVMMAAALMGLVFLSSGSGHDDRIDDPTADDWTKE